MSCVLDWDVPPNDPNFSNKTLIFISLSSEERFLT